MHSSVKESIDAYSSTVSAFSLVVTCFGCFASVGTEQLTWFWYSTLLGVMLPLRGWEWEQGTEDKRQRRGSQHKEKEKQWHNFKVKDFWSLGLAINYSGDNTPRWLLLLSFAINQCFCNLILPLVSVFPISSCFTASFLVSFFVLFQKAMDWKSKRERKQREKKKGKGALSWRLLVLAICFLHCRLLVGLSSCPCWFLDVKVLAVVSKCLFFLKNWIAKRPKASCWFGWSCFSVFVVDNS